MSENYTVAMISQYGDEMDVEVTAEDPQGAIEAAREAVEDRPANWFIHKSFVTEHFDIVPDGGKDVRYEVKCKKCGLKTAPIPSELVAHDRLEECEEVPCQGSVCPVEEGE